MITQAAKNRWAPFGSLKAFPELETMLAPSLFFCEEDVELIVPSIELAGEGPILRSVFYVTKHLLTEVRQDGDFDFIGRGSTFDLRVQLSSQEVKAADGSSTTYETAFVSLRAINPSFGSNIFYVGHERATWLALIKNAFPLALLQHTP